MTLEGKHAFVTGGSGGIGRALCVRFAKLGAEVAFSYLSDHDAADKTVAAMKAASGRLPTVFQASLAEAKASEILADQLFAVFPKVDVFVSNAASGVLRNTTELTAKHWDWTMGVNARAFLLLANRIIPKMPAGGRILALSSPGAVKAIPLYASIGASKAALEAIVRHLVLELGPKGITVNAIAPGIVETAALEHFPHREELVSIAKRRTAAGRLVTPEDVADIAELLVSPLAAMIQGQTIIVDGGYSVLG